MLLNASRYKATAFLFHFILHSLCTVAPSTNAAFQEAVAKLYDLKYNTYIHTYIYMYVLYNIYIIYIYYRYRYIYILYIYKYIYIYIYIYYIYIICIYIVFETSCVMQIESPNSASHNKGFK